ncbi:COBRA, plant [Dillenia turbinata]|uniref:COBRA, plant n=1 Tax=Dillenia turbinata TaxID=194707 RepID=A0AAN8VIR1_9MAGN
MGTSPSSGMLLAGTGDGYVLIPARRRSSRTTNTTVRLPKNFTLLASGPGYTCGPAKVVPPTKFLSQDGRRVTQVYNDYVMAVT